MTKQALIGSIRTVLREKMGFAELSELSEHAKLNEELRLDSVLLLQLFVHLEVDMGFPIPEEALSQKQLDTVGSLADFLLQYQS